MPSDTALDSAALAQNEPRRLPVGVGLMIAAGASLTLWSVVAICVKAVLV